MGFGDFAFWVQGKRIRLRGCRDRLIGVAGMISNPIKLTFYVMLWTHHSKYAMDGVGT